MARNVIFIDIRSGIKMDQLGLEITNFGIVTWYVHKDNIEYATKLFEFIDLYKKTVGENISYNKLVSLGMFAADMSKEYSAKIHSRVEEFYLSLRISTNKYIERVIYPKLEYSECILTMPFVFIKFTIKNRKDYEQVLNNIICICEENGLFLPYRNSFGFRYPSIEFICDYKGSVK